MFDVYAMSDIAGIMYRNEELFSDTKTVKMYFGIYVDFILMLGFGIL